MAKQVTIEGRPAPGRGGERGLRMAVLRDVETGELLTRDGKVIESSLVLPGWEQKAGTELAKSLGLEAVEVAS